jgi:hypothetical protein
MNEESEIVPMEQLRDIIPDGWRAKSASYQCEHYQHLPTFEVELSSIEPPRRSAMEGPHFDVARLRRLAQGIILGSPIPPIEVTPKRADRAYAHRVRNGFHRYYLCMSLGFTKIPVVEIEPLD